MSFPPKFIHLAELLLAECNERNLMVATAESCTGGLIAGLLTEIAGCSSVVDRGFVTYSNDAKRDLLGVPGDMIADFGAVSEPVARAMAEGALNHSKAHIAVSVTGIAGPGGGTPMKPVGLVHIACAYRNHNMIHERRVFGDIGRAEVRMGTIEAAINLMRRQLGTI
ncbi:CinA family protein [Tepidicaulis sp. LMO-SS28]|uniref:CinA family protein n=1 Tax=Tepidicaulis sp. LMO-SS28 TaxID=3447455 RepID=UPI003EE1DBF6